MGSAGFLLQDGSGPHMLSAAHAGSVEKRRAGKESAFVLHIATQLAVFDDSGRFRPYDATGADGGFLSLDTASQMNNGISCNMFKIDVFSDRDAVLSPILSAALLQSTSSNQGFSYSKMEL